MRWREHLVSLNAARRVFRRDSPRRWLARGELERLNQIRSPLRAQQWFGGRWLTKSILTSLMSATDTVSACDLHVESRDGRDRAVRPQVYLRGQLQSWAVSISHSEHAIYVAASTRADVRVGVDVMQLRPLDERFTGFWFTPEEQEWCRRTADPYAACLVWSLKEAYFKAHNDGESFAPRRIDVVTGTPLAGWDGQSTGGSLPGSRLVFEDERRTFIFRRTEREVAALACIPVAAQTMVGESGTNGSSQRTRN